MLNLYFWWWVTTFNQSQPVPLGKSPRLPCLHHFLHHEWVSVLPFCLASAWHQTWPFERFAALDGWFSWTSWTILWKSPWDLGVPHTLGNLNWCKLILRGKGSNVAISDYHTSRFQLVWKSSNPWGYNPYKCPIIAGTALPSTTLKLTFFFQLWVNIFVSDHNLFIFGDSVTVALKSYHLRRYPQQWGHNNVAIPWEGNWFICGEY